MNDKIHNYNAMRPNILLIAALMLLSVLMGTTISIVLSRVILPHPTIATVDMTGLMYRFVKSKATESISLVQKRAEVHDFSQQIETALKEIAREKHLILVPKEAVIAGGQDMTAEVATRLSRSSSPSSAFVEKADESQ